MMARTRRAAKVTSWPIIDPASYSETDFSFNDLILSWGNMPGGAPPRQRKKAPTHFHHTPFFPFLQLIGTIPQKASPHFEQPKARCERKLGLFPVLAISGWIKVEKDKRLAFNGFQ